MATTANPGSSTWYRRTVQLSHYAGPGLGGRAAQPVARAAPEVGEWVRQTECEVEPAGFRDGGDISGYITKGWRCPH